MAEDVSKQLPFIEVVAIKYDDHNPTSSRARIILRADDGREYQLSQIMDFGVSVNAVNPSMVSLTLNGYGVKVQGNE